MSKIYKRPMFRGGGKVSSYGNGIATGLADGGRVALRLGGPPLFDPALTGSFNQPPRPASVYGNTFGGATQSPVGSGTQIVNNATQNTSRTAKLLNKSKSGLASIKNSGALNNPIKYAVDTIGKGFTKIPGGITAASKLGGKLLGSSAVAAISGPKTIADMNRPQTYAALQYLKENSQNNAGVYDETAFDDFTAYDEEYQRLNDTTKYEQLVDDRGFFNKYINPFSIVGNLDNQSDEKIAKIVEADEKKITDKEKDTAAAATGDETPVDPNTAEPIVESRKDRLKRTAKEYQEILGDGIKKDSIFDAMIAGGTSLMEGEGYASAIRGANKALDPIQNIKTASRKLALEEDIAMRKAMAVSAGKNTEMSRRIATMREAGRTPEQIADMVAGIKPETLGEKVSKLGKVDGYAEYIKENRTDVEVVTSKVDISKKPKGKYYIADKFIIVEIDENGKKISEEVIKNS